MNCCAVWNEMNEHLPLEQVLNLIHIPSCLAYVNCIKCENKKAKLSFAKEQFQLAHTHTWKILQSSFELIFFHDFFLLIFSSSITPIIIIFMMVVSWNVRRDFFPFFFRNSSHFFMTSLTTEKKICTALLI